MNLRHAFMLTLTAAMATLSSCVHEFPRDRETVDVALTIHHELPWTFYDYWWQESGRRNASRADDTRAEADWRAAYVIRAYPADETAVPYAEWRFSRTDLTLADFSTTLPLPPGVWDLYAWQDFAEEGQTAFYDVERFSAVTYNRPYRGDTDRREAFEGKTRVSVRSTYDGAVSEQASIDMERPMGRFIFIATDYDIFSAEAESKGHDDSDYSIICAYPLFMPSVYNMFTHKITDSWRGMSFRAKITPISRTEAIIAIDYVFMNHHESGAQVQLGIESPDKRITALSSTITVPMKRGQTTYVRAPFLTTSVGSGLDIDFSFDDDINIEI